MANDRIVLTRRRFLGASVSTAAMTMAGGIARPYLSRAADRPIITHGLQSGDVGTDSGVVWARADRPARMQVEISTTDSFRSIRHGVFADALPESDFTAKVLVEDLPSGQDIFYRIRFQDLSSPTIVGEPMVGRFRTAPRDRRSISFVWSGDTAGQGWGIDEARGGMRTYASMRNNRPDFFIHSGDTIYADGPLVAERKLPNGEIWKNLVIEEKSKAAETLAEFRGNYKYNLLDKNLLAFNAEIPTFAQWDDHEVTNNWWPGEPLTRAEHQRKKYVEKNALVLAARASRAFHEYMPVRAEPAEPGRVYRKISYGPLLDVFMLDMRSYRGPNAREPRGDLRAERPTSSGPRQVAWLKQALMNSQATWKVIAADMPISLMRVLRFRPQLGPRRHRAERRAAARARARDRRHPLVHQARRHPQHGMDHRRRALHRRALLRPEQGGVSGFRAVLGVRVGTDPCRHRHPGRARQHVRHAGGLRQRLDQGAGRRPVAGLRAAVLRPCRHRRRHRGDDRHPQGRRR